MKKKQTPPSQSYLDLLDETTKAKLAAHFNQIIVNALEATPENPKGDIPEKGTFEKDKHELETKKYRSDISYRKHTLWLSFAGLLVSVFTAIHSILPGSAKPLQNDPPINSPNEKRVQPGKLFNMKTNIVPGEPPEADVMSILKELNFKYPAFRKTLLTAQKELSKGKDVNEVSYSIYLDLAKLERKNNLVHTLSFGTNKKAIEDESKISTVKDYFSFNPFIGTAHLSVSSDENDGLKLEY